MKLLLKAVTIVSAIVATQTSAETWTLTPEGSHLAYGTIKKDTVGEVNSFTNLSGQVSADGKAEIEIDLSSVETNIDIRNERMIEYVFRKAGSATLTAEFDMEEISGLATGATAIVDAEAVLSLAGTQVEFDAEMFDSMEKRPVHRQHRRCRRRCRCCCQDRHRRYRPIPSGRAGKHRRHR